MGGSDPPPPPDPIATAGAQTAENVTTAIANGVLSHTNQVDPYGDQLNYNQTGSYNMTDPLTGAQYNVPTYTQTQQLSPGSQQLYDTSLSAKQNMANEANTLSGQAAWMGQHMPLNMYPYEDYTMKQALDPNRNNMTVGQNNVDPNSFRTDSSQYQIDPMRNQVDPNAHQVDPTRFNMTPDQINQYTNTNWMHPFNDQWGQQQSELDQKLADQGLTTGSAAWDNAQRNFGQERQNAYDQYSTAMYGNATNAALGEAAQNSSNYLQGNNQNFQHMLAGNAQDYQQYLAGNNQNYEHALGANAQNYGQMLSGNQLNQQNELQDQGNNFNHALQASELNANLVNQNAQMAIQGENEPINQLSALLSGSQISSPSFGQTPITQVPTTDYAGIVNQNYQDQMAAYNASAAQNSSMMGGLFGLGGAAITGGLTF